VHEAYSEALRTDEEMRAVTIGELEPLLAKLLLINHDDAWSRRFHDHAERIGTALDARGLQVEHVGSTSVPGLAAKPIIDILLVVTDSADEPAYAPLMERSGYELRVREPDWHQHRVFKTRDASVNVHVFSRGCPEISRMLVFRDWLREHAADRRLYELTKRELVQRDWKYTQHYADAKTAVIEEILARALR
jgi:GrpB-like predicted nucleotidyltransferase (UPF0157 family)